MCAAALVCHRWRDPACRALYGRLVLPYRHLDEELWSNSSARDQYPIILLDVFEFDGEGALPRILSRSSTGIRSLKVPWLKSHWSALCSSKLASAFLAHRALPTVLTVLTDLQALTVFFPADQSEVTTGPSSPPPLPFHLQSFTVDVSESGDPVPADFLVAVFEASRTSLRHLRVTTDIAYDEGEDDPYSCLIPVLPLVAGRIQSFDITLIPFPTCLLPSFQLFTSLRILTLELRDHTPVSTPLVLLAFADAHLRITYALECPTVPPLLAFLRHRALKNISRIDFPEIRWGELVVDNELQAECDARSITIYAREDLLDGGL